MMIWLIIIPFIAGLLVLLVPPRIRGFKEGISLIASGVCFVLAILLFIRKPLDWAWSGYAILRLDNLSAFILLAAGLFGFLITIYSFRFMAGKPRLKEYYACFLFTLGSAYGVLLSSHLLLLLVFWGILGITLYLLIGVAGPRAANAAKKTFIIVGGSDAFLLLGIVIIWVLSGSWDVGQVSLRLSGGLAIGAFCSLLIAALAKAGAMPFHTWLPDMSEEAPVPVAAFLPASLDKLIGIYLLARICLNFFNLTSGANLLMMIIGAVTIVAAVMMALIQHDAKRLLGYHAVSQAGYMVLGLGTGNPIGIAGGLFHMLNNAIYKQGLFLATGAVEYKKGTTDLDKLGGLARFMPFTFGAFLVAALAISGVPPLNGFFSKWMVYQGLIEMGRSGEGLGARLWVVWLLAAMFGSALTLASFMKLLYAIFLGRGEDNISRKKDEVDWRMWVPMVVLGLLCILLGVFAYGIAIKGLLIGAVPGLESASGWIGWWKPGLATGLILLGLFIGWIIYKIGNLKGLREDISYIGGEKTLPEANRVTGVEFYNTIKEISLFKNIYRKADHKYFDIYDQGQRIIFFITGKLRLFHNGVLPVYLSWCLIGVIILLFILVR